MAARSNASFSILISRTLCGLSCDEAEVFLDECAAQTKENHLNRSQGGALLNHFPIHSFVQSITKYSMNVYLMPGDVLAGHCGPSITRQAWVVHRRSWWSCPLWSRSWPWHLLRWVIAHSSVLCTYLSHSTMLDFTHVLMFPTDWVDPEARAITCLLCMLST